MEFKAELEGFKELIEALDSKTISMVLNKTVMMRVGGLGLK